MNTRHVLARLLWATLLLFPSWAMSQTVVSFTVVNADTGADIASFATSGSVSIVSTPRINVRANASSVKSVRFTSGSYSRIENTAPYALMGNRGPVYGAWSPAPGTYLIKATPYAGSNASGTAGATVTLTLTVVGPPLPPVENVHVYPATAGPDRNPHKGWNSGWWNGGWAESSVGFQYLAWKDFEPVRGTFDFAKVEQILARPGSIGRHFVLRLYCDWAPTDQNSNCPSWIHNEAGVRRLSGDGGTFLTDFNDPRYVDAALLAIQALAQRYDGDPRVHSFQLGVLGYWGEWHTHGFKQNGVAYELSDTTKNRVLSAYKTLFTRSPLMGRYPWREPLKSTGGIGFHNDYFVPNNGHSNEFDNALSAGGQWQNGPIGGEAPPRSADAAAAERQALFGTATGTTMIATGRYSTMQPGAYRQTAGDPYFADYMRLHRLMGYNLRIDQAVFPDVLAGGQPLNVRVDGTNIGVARLHHPFEVHFALLDAQGLPVAQANAAVDLTSVGPTAAFSLPAALPTGGLVAGSYRLAVRLIQPGAAAAKPTAWGLDARNTYILFANELPVIDGAWSTGNRLVGGWSVLGTVALR